MGESAIGAHANTSTKKALNSSYLAAMIANSAGKMKVKSPR
jgi:hypothetical protein